MSQGIGASQWAAHCISSCACSLLRHRRSSSSPAGRLAAHGRTNAPASEIEKEAPAMSLVRVVAGAAREQESRSVCLSLALPPAVASLGGVGVAGSCSFVTAPQTNGSPRNPNGVASSARIGASHRRPTRTIFYRPAAAPALTCTQRRSHVEACHDAWPRSQAPSPHSALGSEPQISRSRSKPAAGMAEAAAAAAMRVQGTAQRMPGRRRSLCLRTPQATGKVARASTTRLPAS